MMKRTILVLIYLFESLIFSVIALTIIVIKVIPSLDKVKISKTYVRLNWPNESNSNFIPMPKKWIDT